MPQDNIIESAPVTSVLDFSHAHISPKDGLSQDEADLLALGYKQEFKREFTMWSSFGVSFTLLGLLPSIASTLYYGLGYAGTAGMAWGWLVAMTGIQAVASSMAELCSSMPTSGGLYYAAAVLAPPGYGPMAAWVTGWSNWMVQVTSSPSIDYGMATMILALKSFNDENYTATNWQVYLLTVAIMVVQSIVSSLSTKFQSRLSTAGMFINGTAVFLAIICILATNNRTDRQVPKYNSSSEVWGDITNQTEWPNGVAILMSFISIIWTMSGYDAPFHIAEETENAAVAAPRAIVMTSIAGGLLGWALQLVIAYTVVDLADVFDDSLGQPFVTYLAQCVPHGVVMFLTALTCTCAFFMGQSSMISASRVCYAYSRDGCFPLSRLWATVHPVTQTPINAVWFNSSIGCLLLLLIFAGDVAIGAIFSVGAIAAYVAFAIPIGMKVFFSNHKFRPGPWHLGKLSRPLGYYSCGFVMLMVPILCLPAVKGADLDASGMNWTVVVYFGPLVLAIAWFVVDAHKWFKGPRINIQDMLYEDDGTLIDDGVLEGVDRTPAPVYEVSAGPKV